jgi:menaquinone-specific isochorismate synthase
MRVLPSCKTLFQNRRDLYQFLSSCKQESLERNHSLIISISWAIAPVDPLLVLHRLATPDQLSFYFEKRAFHDHFFDQNDIHFASDLTGKVAGRGVEGRGVEGRGVEGRGIGDQSYAIAAIDAAIYLKIEGPNRFKSAKEFVSSTLDSTMLLGEVDRPLAGPHFFGSFTFFDSNTQPASPFPAATIFLPSWQVSRQGNQGTVVANFAIHAGIPLDGLVEKLWHTLETVQAIQYEGLPPLLAPPELCYTAGVDSSIQFQRGVRSALDLIARRTFDKIVLAQAVEVRSPLPLHLTHSLHNLRVRHPDCYVFATSNGQGQTFVGASPEKLIRLRDRHLITDALAGSAPRGQTPCEDATLANHLLTSPKELHEHHVVLDFITQQLVQLGMDPRSAPLRLRQLANIQHLHTPIQAAVPPNVHPFDIVAALHPTPAVAGLPRDIACDHICRYEAFERSLYAAPIGWLDHRGNGEFAVGIRSALLHRHSARLYAGAGIVAGSDPHREWTEVQLKLQALLSCLV